MARPPISWAAVHTDQQAELVGVWGVGGCCVCTLHTLAWSGAGPAPRLPSIHLSGRQRSPMLTGATHWLLPPRPCGAARTNPSLRTEPVELRVSAPSLVSALPFLTLNSLTTEGSNGSNQFPILNTLTGGSSNGPV